jgi:hypothetical protein
MATWNSNVNPIPKTLPSRANSVLEKLEQYFHRTRKSDLPYLFLFHNSFFQQSAVPVPVPQLGTGPSPQQLTIAFWFKAIVSRDEYINVLKIKTVLLV